VVRSGTFEFLGPYHYFNTRSVYSRICTKPGELVVMYMRVRCIAFTSCFNDFRYISLFSQ